MAGSVGRQLWDGSGLQGCGHVCPCHVVVVLDYLAYYVITMRLLCDYYVITMRLLCDYHVITM